MRNLREIRISRNMTQSQLANVIGYNQTIISQWEHGTRDPSTESLIKMSKIFNISVDELLGIEKANNDQNVILNSGINIPREKRETVLDLLSLSERQFEKVQAYIAALVDANEEIKKELK